jgi:hypothetical protein
MKFYYGAIMLLVAAANFQVLTDSIEQPIVASALAAAIVSSFFAMVRS